MNLKIIMILSNIFSSSSSVASLFPALSFESTCFAVNKKYNYYICYFRMIICWFTDTEVIKCSLTYEFCRFIWPFVDKCFESLLHGVDKLLVLHEADVDDVIHFVFEVQQLLHHCFVFFWIDYDCASKSLDFQDIGKQQLATEYAKQLPCIIITVDAVIPLCTLSSAAGGPERHLALDWRADREETDPEFCSRPAGESALEVSKRGQRSELKLLLYP